MKIIDQKTHGILDYLYGVLLLASPWLFNFYEGGMESWVAIVLGAGTLVYSMVTNYELGLLKLIPMRIHLLVDLVAGIFLAASPWLFGFSEQIIWPHVVFGVIAVFVYIATQRDPASGSGSKEYELFQKK